MVGTAKSEEGSRFDAVWLFHDDASICVGAWMVLVLVWERVCVPRCGQCDEGYLVREYSVQATVQNRLATRRG